MADRSISIIIPAYCEEENILDTSRMSTTQRYEPLPLITKILGDATTC